MNKQKVALVLSTGGARGIGHIGVIEELERQGYEISSIAGCSMGAMVGAFYASGKLSEGKNFFYNLKKRKEFLKLADVTISNKGLVKGNRIVRELEKIIPNMNIEDLPIPYTAIATNLLDGKEAVFEKGSLIEAVRASISLPTIFKPLEKDNMLLIDGGIINPLPLNRIQRTENDLLVGVAVSAFNEAEQKKEIQEKYNLHSLMTDTITIVVQQLVTCSIQTHKPDMIVQIPNREYGILQFKEVEKLIENGVKATKATLADYERKQFNVGNES